MRVLFFIEILVITFCRDLSKKTVDLKKNSFLIIRSEGIDIFSIGITRKKKTCQTGISLWCISNRANFISLSECFYFNSCITFQSGFIILSSCKYCSYASKNKNCWLSPTFNSHSNSLAVLPYVSAGIIIMINWLNICGS